MGRAEGQHHRRMGEAENGGTEGLQGGFLPWGELGKEDLGEKRMEWLLLPLLPLRGKRMRHQRGWDAVSVGCVFLRCRLLRWRGRWELWGGRRGLLPP